MKIIKTPTALILTASILMSGSGTMAEAGNGAVNAADMKSFDPSTAVTLSARIPGTNTNAVEYSLPAEAAPMANVSAKGGTFRDIRGHWAEGSIKWAIAQGFAKGYEDGTFRPNGNVTPSEFAVMLSRVVKLEGSSSVKGKIPTWAKGSIESLYGSGYITDNDITSLFNGMQLLNRSWAGTLFAKALIKSGDGYAQAFEDTKDTIIPVTEFYRGGISKTQIPYVAIVFGTGLMGGYPDGSFGSTKNITRAETVTLLQRFVEEVIKTSADSYRPLKELREVGTTGTNLRTMGAKWAGENGGAPAPFTDIIGKQATLKNSIGKVMVHRALAYDITYGAAYKGIYYDMFYKPSSYKVKKGMGVAFELTISPLKTMSSVQQYSESYQGILGGNMDREIEKVYGYKVLRPGDNNVDFLKGRSYKGFSRSDVSSSFPVRVITDDSSLGTFYFFGQ